MATISLFKCPTDAALPTLTDPTCRGQYGQTGLLAFQLKQSAAPFTSSDIATVTKWNTLIAADDATKIVVVPVTGFTLASGDYITEGGNDNTTFRGMPTGKGVGFTTASGMVKGATPEFMALLDQLTQHSLLTGDRTNLTAYFLTDENFIQSGADLKGIPVYSVLFKDIDKGGTYKDSDNYAFQFYMPDRWTRDTKYTKASFDVLDLKNG